MEQTVSVTDSTVATYAFDDEPTLTSAQVTGANTVTLEFSEELVGGSTNALVVANEWCEQHREWVHGEWIDGDVDAWIRRCSLVMKRR